jgi:flagellar secretion chaperone FliS
MLETAVSRYRQVVVSTSTPGELLLALYGGLLRFLKGARHQTEHKQRVQAAEFVSKARAIICELDMALDHDTSPELCRNLSGVYGFCLDRLRLATRENSVQAIDDVIRVIAPLYQAWQIAVPQATREQGRADSPR